MDQSPLPTANAALAASDLPEPTWEQAAFTTGVQVYGFELTPGPDGAQAATATRAALRSAFEEEQWWPVLTDRGPAAVVEWAEPRAGGDPDLLWWWTDVGDEHADVLDELIAARRAAQEDFVSDEGPGPAFFAHARDLYDPATVATRIGPAPARPGAGTPRDSVNPSRPLWLCLFPVADSYRLPPLLAMPWTNNWWALPPHPYLTVADSAAVLRSWSERHGANVYYLSPCSLELEVEHPPLPTEEAARAAVEQFAYCFDLSQVRGEPITLADDQVRTHHWIFWWD